MFLKRLIVFFVTLLYLFSSSPYQNQTKASTENKAIFQYSYFTENKGQWDSNILFMGQTSFGRIALAKESIYYQVYKSPDGDGTFEMQTIKFSFLNSLIPLVKGVGILTQYNNYYLGSDTSKWATHCRNFSKITYVNVWEGIDLSYFFTSEGIKYEYFVKPGANASNINIQTNLGSQITQTTAQDPLLSSTLLGASHEDDFAYAITVDSQGNSYVAGETYSLDFPLIPGSYKTTYKGEGDGVISKIDPSGTMLLYSTFLGGSGNDYVRSIAVDSSGAVYATGTTGSTDFPTSPGAFHKKLKGKGNAFIIKLNSSGSSLLYGTYLGGTGDDFAYGISVDANGSAYVTGTTGSLDFPTTEGAFYSKNRGGYDIFVSKINSGGTMLLYSVVLGGGDFDYARGIFVDNSGSAYIAGSTGSFDFPVSSSSYQGSLKGLGNAFILKLNSKGSSLLFSTYMGGSYYDYAYGVSVDQSGCAYVCGATGSMDFPVTEGAFQSKNKDNNDAFVTKINATGTALLYSTYLGGSGGDGASGIIVNTGGEAYIGGTTDSTVFPTSKGSYQATKKGGEDVFVSKLNPKGSLVYSTYLGSSWDDEAYGITLDNEGRVLICGDTKGADFPITKGAYWNNQSGESDIFISKLNLAPVEESKKTQTIIELWIGYRIALLDGDLEFLDTIPVLVHNTTMVPLRFIAESLQAAVFYSAKNQEIDILLGSTDITLWINKPVAQIESIPKEGTTFRVVILDVSPFIRNDRTLVPVRFISEIFGAEVMWNGKDQKVTIVRKG